MVSHSLETYGIDDHIARTDSKIACDVTPSTTLPLKISNALWLKMLRCAHVYDKYVLEEIFTERLYQPLVTVWKHTGVATGLPVA